MQVAQTAEFAEWLGGLRDVVARRAIVKRIVRLQSTGHFGDTGSVGDNVSEMRFHIGPGYRVYFTISAGAIILWGGDKNSQSRDIVKAKILAAGLP